MINTKHMFEFESNTDAATTRAQVIPLTIDSGIRTPNKDINPEYIAAFPSPRGDELFRFVYAIMYTQTKFPSPRGDELFL